MHQLYNNKLPFSSYEDYVEINAIHSHITGQTQKAVYFKPRVKQVYWKKAISLWRCKIMRKRRWFN